MCLLSAGGCVDCFLYTHLLFATEHILVDCQIHTTKTTQLTWRHTEQEAATILTYYLMFFFLSSDATILMIIASISTLFHHEYVVQAAHPWA